MLVALVGMMGVGKSTVAEPLAERLGSVFCDLDSLVAKRVNQPVQQVFEEQGEEAFRILEHQVLQQLTEFSQERGCVLATGGGVVKTAACRALLSQSWRVIWLQASPWTLALHLQQSEENRPLLQGKAGANLLDTLAQLLAERQRWYEEVSELSVSVDDKPVAEVVDEIATYLLSHRCG